MFEASPISVSEFGSGGFGSKRYGTNSFAKQENEMDFGDLNTILTGGVGTVTFFTIFAYAVLRWFFGLDFFD